MANIHIIGTSHIAKESYKSVKNTILKKKPDAVAVELDPKRIYALFSKQKDTPGFAELKKYGITTYIFAKIGAWLQKKLGEQVGLAPGSEIKAAILSAKKVDAKIYLIDQDIEITLKKLSKTLTLKEKLKLIFVLFFGFLMPINKTIKKIDISKVPEKETIELITIEFKRKFPKLYKVLVSDRDKYMARQLLAIAKHHQNEKIIVVVGAGHVPGITKLLSEQNAF
jgi:pheromone shutdown-related protein TraB